jgi:LmbE family N-acetylglucosaminyl deacetylase
MYGRKILLLAAHPDDEVVGCAAAALRALQAGADMNALFLTNGVPARVSFLRWRNATAYRRKLERRLGEMRAVADMLGFISVDVQPISSRTVKDRLQESRDRIEAAIQTTGADVLWVPAYEGGHQDHDAINFLASRFRGRIEIWEYSEYHYAGGRAVSNQFIRTCGGEIILELTPEESRFKTQLLQTYASEALNLNYIITIRESFRPLPVYDYRRPPHDGKLFYQRYQWVPFNYLVDYSRPEDLSEIFRAAGELKKG